MLFIFDNIISEKKQIDFAMLDCYGIGKMSRIRFLARLGYNFGSKKSFLQRKSLKKVEYFVYLIFEKKIIRTKVGYGLKLFVLDRLNKIKKSKTTKGLRHLQFLPVRGQRTRKNAGTQKSKRPGRKKMPVAGKKKKK